MRVLVADDNEAERRILCAHLSRWGYDPVAVNNGAEAWEALNEEGGPRLALLDWNMPLLDGPEVCRRVRQTNSEPYTYLLLVTARNSPGDVVSGLDSGADDYVKKPFSPQELQLRLRAGERIVNLHGALIEERERLRLHASLDPLTDLLNRATILDVLSREMARAARDATPISVLLVDVDHFKKVNDTYGHDAGDAVLAAVAWRMRPCVRPYDSVARYGGEEFLIVLPACDGPGAYVVAERLHNAVRSTPITLPGGSEITVTTSTGVNTVRGQDGVAWEEAIRNADVALYRAKAGGRNRVEVAGGDPPPTER